MAKEKTIKTKKKPAAAPKKSVKVKKKAASTKKSTPRKAAKNNAVSGSDAKKPLKKTPKKAPGKAVDKTPAANKKKIVKKTATTVAKKSPGRAAKKTATKVAANASRPRSAGTRKKPAAARVEKFDMNTPLPPAETPLTDDELQMFRNLLLEKRTEIAGDVFTLQSQAMSDNRQNAAGDLSSMPIHMADIGSDNYEKEFTLGLLESERNLLRDIDDAINRIDDRTYGVCEGTGRPIGKARLKAQPWVKYCYEYMLAREKGAQSPAW